MRKRIYMLQGGSSVRRHTENRSCRALPVGVFQPGSSFSPPPRRLQAEKETLFMSVSFNFAPLTYSQNNDLRCTAALITLSQVFVLSLTRRRCPCKRVSSARGNTSNGVTFLHAPWTRSGRRFSGLSDRSKRIPPPRRVPSLAACTHLQRG